MPGCFRLSLAYNITTRQIDVTFGTRNSLTNNEQYYAIFGWTTGMVYANTLGSQPFANVDISSYPKGGKNFTVTIKAPDYFDGNASKANLTSAIFSQTGASGGVSILFFDDVVDIAK
jgi:hypothetical protein